MRHQHLLARLIAGALMLAMPQVAWAQGTVLQGGAQVSGHAPVYIGQGSQAVVGDSGPASGGGNGVGLKELNLTVRGTGSAPYANAGTGPLGTNLCDYDAPITNPTGYHYLCFSPNAQGGALIAAGAGGGASPLPLQLSINGVLTPLIFNPQGQGPSTAGDIPMFLDSSGTKFVDSGINVSNLRQVLVADKNYYVNYGTGNDANGCTLSQPCRTRQHVWNLIQQTLDLAGHTVFVNLSGTSTDSFTASGTVPGQGSGANIVFQGAVGNAATVVTDSPGNFFNWYAINGATITVQWLTINSGTSPGGGSLVAGQGGQIAYGNVIFGPSYKQVYAAGGGYTGQIGPVTISGSAAYHVNAENSGFAAPTGSITLTGAPNFSQAFAEADENGTILASGMTWSGSSTGVRYYAVAGGVIDASTVNGILNGALPGNAAGAVNAGIYIVADGTQHPGSAIVGNSVAATSAPTYIPQAAVLAWQSSTGASTLYALGSDTSTNGRLDLVTARSDGSNPFGALRVLTDGSIEMPGSVLVNTIRAGSTASPLANTISLSFDAGTPQLTGFGPNASTNGTLNINIARSDGSNAATAIAISSTAGVTMTGTLTLTGLPNSCSGKPTNSVAAVAGALTLCP